ncbi:unnamed protein product [Closterium sp. NIES-65]|nr:unnamed protein product [Closterium sp. NIES-65]
MAAHKSLSTGGEAASEFSDVPGGAKSVTTRVMETGASAVQQFGPIRQIGQHLCAFHYYANDMSRQVEAHHYCSHVSEDVHQCLVYDSDQPSARLIGVEFIVSEKIFLSLPEDEQRMWHSHEYEVKSGLLIMPGMPAVAELPVMSKLVKTFGKTWHFWQFDRGDTLPLGVPQLMGAFFADGQLKPELPKDFYHSLTPLVRTPCLLFSLPSAISLALIFPSSLAAAVEQRYGVQLEERRQLRADLTGPELAVDRLAQQFKRGMGYETQLKECQLDGQERMAKGGVGAASVTGVGSGGMEHVGQAGTGTTGSDCKARIGG